MPVRDDVVTVAHPALLVRAPSRGDGRERPGLVRIDTPVRLRTLSRADTAEGPRIPVHRSRWVATRLIDGRPWRVVGDDAGLDRGTGRALGVEGLRAWLSGAGIDPARRDQSEAMRCFSATPLTAYSGTPEVFHPVRPLRRADAPRRGEIVRDHREEARSALAAFVADDLAVVDGVAMVRFPGPVAQFASATAILRLGTDVAAIPRFPGWPDPTETLVGYRHYRVDRVARARAGLGIGEVLPDWQGGRRPDRRTDLSGVRMAGVDDLRLSLHEILNRNLAYPVIGADPVEWENEALRRQAVPLVERAATHTLGPDDLWEACDVVEALAGARCRFGYARDRADMPERRMDTVLDLRSLAYVRDYARPVLEEEGLDRREDRAALAALAPGIG